MYGTPRWRDLCWLAIFLATMPGCGRPTPSATVEGTVRLNGEPLDHCMVTFLPYPGEEAFGGHSTGVTDDHGHYRLRHNDQRDGAAVGRHRVTVQDLLVSTGMRRRDHGTVDREIDNVPPPPVRPSRVPVRYASTQQSPLSEEVLPGHQTINLKLE